MFRHIREYLVQYIIVLTFQGFRCLTTTHCSLVYYWGSRRPLNPAKRDRASPSRPRMGWLFIPTSLSIHLALITGAHVAPSTRPTRWVGAPPVRASPSCSLYSQYRLQQTHVKTTGTWRHKASKRPHFLSSVYECSQKSMLNIHIVVSRAYAWESPSW